MDVRELIGEGFGNCPFLSEALRQSSRCIKNENSLGVCTINTASNGVPQDWLACPYRVISSDLVKVACASIFGKTGDDISQPIPATLLSVASERERFKAEVSAKGAGFVLFQAKLGGEISVISSPRSPEISFDVTLVEVLPTSGSFQLGRYGIFEIQTMDFHGSYRAAVGNLKDALRLHMAHFSDSLKANMKWAAEGVEGPNIANVFKRTFYQILLKFQLSGKGAAAGTVLAIPQAVWDSWQPFLGAPELLELDDGTYRIKPIDGFPASLEPTNSYICVFDLDAGADAPVSPLNVKAFIRVNAEELSHHAFKEVPAGMLKSLNESDSILARIKERLASYWPELA